MGNLATVRGRTGYSFSASATSPFDLLGAFHGPNLSLVVGLPGDHSLRELTR